MEPEPLFLFVYKHGAPLEPLTVLNYLILGSGGAACL